MRGPGLCRQPDLGAAERHADGEHLLPCVKRRSPPGDVLSGAESVVSEPHPASGVHAGGSVHGTLYGHDRVGPFRDRCAGHDPAACTAGDLKGRDVARREIDSHVEFDHLRPAD